MESKKMKVMLEIDVNQNNAGHVKRFFGQAHFPWATIATFLDEVEGSYSVPCMVFACDESGDKIKKADTDADISAQDLLIRWFIQSKNDPYYDGIPPHSNGIAKYCFFCGSLRVSAPYGVNNPHLDDCLYAAACKVFGLEVK